MCIRDSKIIMTQQKQTQSLDVNDALSQSEAFIIKYKKAVIAGAVAIVVIVGGFFALKYGYFEPREEKAQSLLTAGQQYLMQGDYEKALKGDGKTFPGYVKIAGEYSFTDAANAAKMYAGLCYAKSGKTKEAIKYLENFSPRGDQSLSPQAVFALANCYASDNQTDKAIETFKKAADLADNPILSPISLLEAGKLLESQKKNEEALKLYTRIRDEYPTSAMSAPQPAQNGAIMSPDIDRYIERVSGK